MMQTTSTTVPDVVQRVFAFVSDPHHLPFYFSPATAVRLLGPGRIYVTTSWSHGAGPASSSVDLAWFHVDNSDYSVNWRSLTDHHWEGQLLVTGLNADTRLTAQVTTDTALDKPLDESLHDLVHHYEQWRLRSVTVDRKRYDTAL